MSQHIKSVHSTPLLGKSLKTLFGASVASLLLMGSAHAFHGKSDGHCRKGKFHNMTPEQREAKMNKRFERMANKLDFTDTQKKQAQAVFAQNKSQRLNLHTQANTLREQLKSQRKSNAADANIDATHDQLYKVKKQLRQLRRSEHTQLQAIMTPEQRATIQNMQQRRWSRHER